MPNSLPFTNKVQSINLFEKLPKAVHATREKGWLYQISLNINVTSLKNVRVKKGKLQVAHTYILTFYSNKIPIFNWTQAIKTQYANNTR